jgi:ABC-2 type transport system ATP-binding protein
LIAVERVGKRFGRQTALEDVSLRLSGAVALLGPNGSGKSTLLRLLATLIRCDSGRVSFEGIEYRRQLRTLRQRIGYLPQQIDLPGDLTPRTLLRYLAQIRHVADESRPDALLSALRLAAAADRPLGSLSGGQLRLVCLAQSLLARPEILLLDEPFSGLGIEERQSATRLLTVERAALVTVFSVHTLAEAARLAQQAVVLRAGRVAFHGRIDALSGDGCIRA